MNFTNPTFFWALLAVAIPIIIHLLNFRRQKLIYFSNTQFLENINKDTKKKKNIKNILILISRILAIVCLVFFFAGPYILNNNNKTIKSTKINIMYVDNSFSMEAEGKDGELLKQAIQISKEIIYKSPIETEYIIITNDLLPQHQHIMNRDMVLQNLNKIETSPNHITTNDVLLKSSSLLPRNSSANLYIISDMQESFIQQNEEFKADTNIFPIFIKLKPEHTNNLYIDSCWFASPTHKKGQTEILSTRIVNISDEDYINTPLELFINDSLKALSGFNIEANQTKDIDIEYVNTNSGFAKGRIELTDYPITYDNHLYFNYKVEDKINVLIINDGERNKYLSSIFESNTDNFNLTQVELGNEHSVAFSDFFTIILCNFKQISSGLISDLNEFTRNGGSLVYIPSDKNDIKESNLFLSSFNSGQFELSNTISGKIDDIETKHEIFKNVFLKQNKKLDFPNISIAYKHKSSSNSILSPIIRLENNSPILSAGNYEKGKLYVFTSPLTDDNSEFLKSPLFAPSIFNIALNSQVINPLYYTIKSNTSIELNTDNSKIDSEICQIKNENIDIIAPNRFIGKKMVISIPEQIQQAGTYEIHNNDNFISPISFNFNRAESILKYTSEEDLEKIIIDKFNNNARILEFDNKKISNSLENISKGKDISQLFLIFCLLFLLFEMLIIRLMK